MLDSKIYNSQLNHSLKILKDYIIEIREILFEKKVLCLVHTLRRLEYSMESAISRADICLVQARNPWIKKEILCLCANMRDLQNEFGSAVINGTYSEKKEKITNLIENSLSLIGTGEWKDEC